MALTDIHFQEGDNQYFVVEIPTGLLNAPADIMADSGPSEPVHELTAETGGGDIFIIGE